jgi:hypothetical protein
MGRIEWRGVVQKNHEVELPQGQEGGVYPRSPPKVPRSSLLKFFHCIGLYSRLGETDQLRGLQLLLHYATQ